MGSIKMSEIDRDKLEKMWNKILEYEKGDGMTDSDKKAVSKIVSIIDEVYRECL